LEEFKGSPAVKREDRIGGRFVTRGLLGTVKGEK
jgi:hypothetical protein